MSPPPRPSLAAAWALSTTCFVLCLVCLAVRLFALFVFVSLDEPPCCRYEDYRVWAQGDVTGGASRAEVCGVAGYDWVMKTVRDRFVVNFAKYGNPRVRLCATKVVGKCPKCELLAEQQGSDDLEVRSRATFQFQSHALHARQCRSLVDYDLTIAEAGKKCFLMLDKVDHCKTDLPRGKVRVSGNTFELACTNVVLAGQSAPELFVFEPGWVGRGAGAWLTTLLAAALPHALKTGRWRRVLHIHIDRAPDGWNRIVVGFMCYCVATGVVDKFIISAILVGHNHVLVDTMQALHEQRKKRLPRPGVLTVQESLEKASLGGAKSCFLDCAARFTGLFDPCMGPQFGGITGKAKVR